MKIMMLLSLSLFASNIFAVKVQGIDIPDTHTLQEKKLVLNGVGIRKATWFKVKVYVGSLYVLKKTSNIQEILNQDYPKYLQMDFVYSVDKEKLIKGWNDGFKAALSSADMKKYQQQINSFNASMTDIKKGQHIRIQFSKPGVNVSVNGSSYKMIQSEGFAKALLSIWFIKPRDEGLAKGLQGLN